MVRRRNPLPHIAQPEPGKTVLPGFGRPINYVPQEGDVDYIRDHFPSALSGQDMDERRTVIPMTTLRELTMLQLMNSITDKPEWYKKINNPEIVQKWREEALASGRDITQSMLDWCIAELQHNARKLPSDPTQHPPTFVYNGDVYKSDVAVSPELKRSLQEAVKAFEAKIPERLKDWHPDSDEKVWDLVHPSLFPLIYGRTRVLADGQTTTLEDCVKRSGEGVAAAGVAEEGKEEEETMEWGVRVQPWGAPVLKKPYSARFQWLPCEVDISGEEAKITTYINNLHPQEEKPLYALIEKLIEASIPLWDKSLAPLSEDSFMINRDQRIPYESVKYDPDPEDLSDSEGPQQSSNEAADAWWERREGWIQEMREANLVMPEPGEFTPLEEPPKFGLREVYGGRGRGLQVIVKLANIELTPEKPRYEGGSWHVEGQMNEHIVASALYYYSNENITPSHLSFRAQLDQEAATVDISYPQSEHGWLTTIFGCEQGESAVQELGSVETREGRLVSLTNILQHRVGPFELVDKEKKGHRKIVALFLVDPGVRVISTAHVPCQQQEWWWKATQELHLELEESTHISKGGSKGAGSRSKSRPIRAGAGVGVAQGIAKLPLELQDHVLEDVDFPISLQEAKRLRLELMQERKEFVVKSGKLFESNTFSLCEH